VRNEFHAAREKLLIPQATMQAGCRKEDSCFKTGRSAAAVRHRFWSNKARSVHFRFGVSHRIEEDSCLETGRSAAAV